MVLGGSVIVKDIIYKVAQILSLDDVMDALDKYGLDEYSTLPNSVLREVDLLVTSFNLVNNMIATNYVNIERVEKVMSSGFVSYIDINDGRVILGVRKVVDSTGESVPFMLKYDGIEMPTGEYDIVYTVFPKDLSIDDHISEYHCKLSDTIFVYGVASEYLLIKGNIDDAVVYDTRFKQMLLDSTRPKHSITLPQKRFV